MVDEFFDGFGGREGVYHQRDGSLLVFAINSVRVVTLIDGFGGREGVYHQREVSLLVLAVNSVRVVTLTLAPVMVQISRDVDLVTGPPVGTERVIKKDAAVRPRTEHARTALAVLPQKRAARRSLQTAAVAPHRARPVLGRDGHAPSAVEAVHVVLVASHFGGLAVPTAEVGVAVAVVFLFAVLAVDAVTFAVMEAVMGAVGPRTEAAEEEEAAASGRKGSDDDAAEVRPHI
eukprot:CAMPEP_0194348008 /NCGR_PEP_ID=MMETSP0171-20130528/106301_1 /TAXON_ID=218684 /ORGANISM="Corethron pennatum, Strain L29A3" /LENGTH=231 /DNA_ID=CAMNT_0039115313 /DNA_START=679 /DNA_END=1375 /DNA_ORIENTATION=+